MSMVKLRVLDNRFQADVWTQALEAEGIAHRVRSFMDTAYDGLYVSQKGWGVLYVEEEDLARAQALDQALSQHTPGEVASAADLARRLEHTLLAPEAGPEDLARHLEECVAMQCVAACVSPWLVERAARALAGTDVAVCSVVGFPLGASTGRTKLNEALELAAAGAVELDLVLNRGLVLAGQMAEAVAEVAAVAETVRPAVLKVILETSVLGPELSGQAARALASSGAAFLKTGSGFFGPATAEDVALLAEAAAGLGVKAAGGIKTLDLALELLQAGAARLGTSRGWAIYQQARERWPHA
ncbi:MAG: deoxyribose-phosphate aldolase [Desulfarculus sp.]|nr:MAG: deoxyribose-phosphate aldolase [Desulfarculus sp.]